MSGMLQVRKAFKDALAPLEVKVLFRGEKQPVDGLYGLIDVIDAPAEGDFSGPRARRYEMQLTFWSKTSSIDPFLKAEAALPLLKAAGWTLLAGPLPAYDQDAGGQTVWWGALMRFEKLA
jgi:hypothetical protein